MNHIPFPSLYNSMTLRERAAWHAVEGNEGRFDAPLAKKRFERWKAQPPFANPALFAARLAQEDLTEATFTCLLGQSRLSNPGDILPGWAQQLQKIFGEFQDDARQPGSASYAGEDNGQLQRNGFLIAFAPLIRSGRERLHHGLAALRGLSEHPMIADPRKVEAMLFANVRGLLERVVTKTLVLELNISRLEGTLRGATPEERFADFVEQFQNPARVNALISEYPVLFRLAASRIDAWVNSSLELVERLCADWGMIQASFNAGLYPGELVRVDRRGRSTRAGGRAVLVLIFDSGFKIVYKPRSLAVEHHFMELLERLNQEGQQPPFRPLKLADQGTYGWVEWLAPAECSSEAEVRRFYQRQGAYLALFYALEATDFHLDNVFAVGENPMLIDLEALFHPRDAEPDLSPLEQVLDRAMYHSVLRTGLLPEPELGDEESTGFDLSGLAGGGNQWTPYTVPRWENEGTDIMRLVRLQTILTGGKNLPTLRDKPVHVVDYQDAIEDGFISIYQWLMSHRDEFLEPGGLLDRFAQDEIRILARSGKRYSTLLDESFHPNLLRDSLDRERFLDRLWLGVEREPSLSRLIPYEKTALLAGEIPYFTTQASSCDAYNGGQRIKNFFPRSGLEAARQRIAGLNVDDLARQRWFIHASLATVVKEGSQNSTLVHSSSTKEVASRQRLLGLALTIGQRLDLSALRAAGEVSWLGVSLVEECHWEIGALDLDLYNGLPGVALFLAHLGALTGEERWTKLAQEATATLMRYIAEEKEAGEEAFPDIGISDGLGGLLYSLSHLSARLCSSDLRHSAAELVAFARSRAGKEEESGLAHGVAGCLVGLLALHQVAPAQSTLAVAQHCGECLLQESRQAFFRKVDRPSAVIQPFAHFFQGRLGTSWALLTLAKTSGDTRFRQAALQLIDEELSSNQRAGATGVSDMKEGAAGIALGYLRMLPYITDVDFRTRLIEGSQSALQALLATFFGRNHALGHGDLGYLDLFLQASDLLEDEQWGPSSGRQAAMLIASMKQNGFITGIPLGVESPGLMAGLAGIGYGLLRLADPQRVPSVLALSMPRVN
jgi:type 2 lantibiotic biosynthesis protein LanM